MEAIRTDPIPHFGLQGRGAVITGGSSGIGRAMAYALGRAGAQIHLVARDAQRLENTADAFRSDGIDASWVSVDLADAEATAGLAASPELLEADIVITCAGVNPRPPLADLTPQQYAHTLQVNLHAPHALGQAAGPAMAARGYGRLINIGSQQSWSAFGNSGAYGISKAAVCGLTRSQAEAWSRHGVTANTVIPGFVVTPMTEATLREPGREEALATRTMAGRNGTPEDFAGIAVFLASPASAYITGQTIAVDGGFSVA